MILYSPAQDATVTCTLQVVVHVLLVICSPVHLCYGQISKGFRNRFIERHMLNSLLFIRMEKGMAVSHWVAWQTKHNCGVMKPKMGSPLTIPCKDIVSKYL